MAFDEEIHKLQQEIEIRFRDVRDHVILSVKEYSMWIAFILMGLTLVILVCGTLIVWYRHRSGRHKTYEDEDNSHVSDDTEKEKIHRSNSENSVSNGSIRNSGSESPVKSRIPVRTKVKQS